ncbi:hypothetical protein, partial [Nostoc sp.]|uniref:hypothetical protein n=1 Tax=Nostoc sp. TaxID=1180 RepID=UPI002FF72489
ALSFLLVRRSSMLPNSNLLVPRIWDFCKRSNESLDIYIKTDFQASGDRITKALNAELLSK